MWKLSTLVLTFPALCLVNTAVYAQSITAAPDGTGTIIQHNGNTYSITGGTPAGTNLFHSFQQFGLNQGEIANFLSDPTVANIFGRVVGGDPSIIDGLIQANPNLYLMNPAGIVFGANASLNVGGDFFATTADQICFEGGCFDSVGLNDYSVLAGSPTTLGFLQSQPGGLINAGTLTVQKGKSIHLSGGTVVNLGQVVTPGGMATVAAIPGERQVRLNSPGSLLSLEVTDEVLANGINPFLLPELLAGTPGNLNAKVIDAPLGNVVIEGEIAAEQIDLYAAGQVTPSDVDLIQGDTRVTRFSESGENPEQAVFIDARVDSPEDLLFGAEAGMVSQIIERDEDGVAVISEQLTVISEAVGELESVAIVAEGNVGNFWLGSEWLTAENIGDYQAGLAQWGGALASDADILLYSCFTALGATGEALVDGIASMVGADVAASVDVTGSVNYGGNWELEHNIGSIETENPFTPEIVDNWEGKLTTITVTNLNNTGSGSLRDAIQYNAMNGDFITFHPNLVGTLTLAGEDRRIDGELDWQQENITLDADSRIRFSGNGNSRFAYITANNATIKNSVITNSNSANRNQGGAIRHTSPGGKLIIENSIISGNTATVNGGGIYSTGGSISLINSTISGNLAASGVANGIYSQTGSIAISSTGDFDLIDSIVTQPNSSINITANNINVFTSIQSRGGDISLYAKNKITAFNSDNSISSNGLSGGDINIFAESDINIRNVTAFATAGDGGNISITSANGSINTTSGGSQGLIDSSSLGGDAGNISIQAPGTITVGTAFAEAPNGSGGNLGVNSSSLVRFIGAEQSLSGSPGVSASTASDVAGGSITIRHGGQGIVTFTVGDSSINGSAGLLTTGNIFANQTISPVSSFLFDYSQGGISILSTNQPLIDPNPIPGSNPTALEFNGQSPAELFVKIIGDRLGAVTHINQETGEVTWLIPDEPIGLTGEIEIAPINIQQLDELLEGEYEDYIGEEIDEEEEGITLANIQETLRIIQAETGTNPVIIYAIIGTDRYDVENIELNPDAIAGDIDDLSPEEIANLKEKQIRALDNAGLGKYLELILVSPEDQLIRKIVPEATVTVLTDEIDNFTSALHNTKNHDYLAPAQQLHTWLIAPLESELQGLNVDTLIFAMSSGLRTLPLAALHNPQTNRFLIEDYSLGMIPSVSLTNSNYQPLHNTPILAMGAAKVPSHQRALPVVPTELNLISALHPESEQFQDTAFTLPNLAAQSRNHTQPIIHLASHAEFAGGQANDQRYNKIHFYDQPVRFDDLRSLGWHTDPQIELLVLSACQTALGDPHAELGFAGLAIQTGVKSALASLWQVDDLGTLGLMSSFYAHLNDPAITIKAEALRQAQLALLRGEIHIEQGRLNGIAPILEDDDNLPGIALPSAYAGHSFDLSHPFYWSAFTFVGSPW
ncbi:MAG: CHAT domain-containing protein [Spirulina sp. SIO3F2]|nr:CHAT domain-containing protein [Spirulina sp. SIO3F2]